MEKHNINNPLLDWINNDKELYNIIQEIENSTNSEYEKAKVAFDKLANYYNLPKFIDDVKDRDTIQIDDKHLYDPISMYEVLAKIKFSDKNPDNLKSNVLMTAYLMINKFEPIIDEELENFLGDEEFLGFGYKGENVDVELIPVKVGESWFDLGCKVFIINE